MDQSTAVTAPDRATPGPSRSKPRQSGLPRRTRQRLVQQTRAELFRHCADAPTTVQQAMIEQLIQLRIRLETMDRKFAQTGELSLHDSKTYLAWSACYTRTLKALGAATRTESRPYDHLAAIRAAHAADRDASASITPNP